MESTQKPDIELRRQRGRRRRAFGGGPDRPQASDGGLPVSEEVVVRRGLVRARQLRVLTYLAVQVVPWSLRRRLLNTLLGYEIDPTARIFRSWVVPWGRVVLGPNAWIGPFTMVGRGVHDLIMGEGARLGQLNWVSGEPREDLHYQDQGMRRPHFIMDEHATVTGRHYINCTDLFHMHRYSVLGGGRSAVWTHGVDYRTARQMAKPIEIGEYSLVATNSVLLPGAKVPHHCVVGAMSLVTKDLGTPYRLYGGTPAKEITELKEDEEMFSRPTGWFT